MKNTTHINSKKNLCQRIQGVDCQRTEVTDANSVLYLIHSVTKPQINCRYSMYNDRKTQQYQQNVIKSSYNARTMFIISVSIIRVYYDNDLPPGLLS